MEKNKHKNKQEGLKKEIKINQDYIDRLNMEAQAIRNWIKNAHINSKRRLFSMSGKSANKWPMSGVPEKEKELAAKEAEIEQHKQGLNKLKAKLEELENGK